MAGEAFFEEAALGLACFFGALAFLLEPALADLVEPAFLLELEALVEPFDLLPLLLVALLPFEAALPPELFPPLLRDPDLPTADLDFEAPAFPLPADFVEPDLPDFPDLPDLPALPTADLDFEAPVFPPFPADFIELLPRDPLFPALPEADLDFEAPFFPPFPVDFIDPVFPRDPLLP